MMNYFVLPLTPSLLMVNGLHQNLFNRLILIYCIYCKLQIGVQFSALTVTRTFVHLPGHINNAARLKTCRFNKLQTVPEQTSSQTIPPPEKRLRPANTTIRQWRCCWCDTCWHGDKVCPKCCDWIYVFDA
ncbi:putative zinc ribbon protein [Yersinia massiliensis]|uniref:putative zinc ribbon protein n=1 Tax=Yersinia massiliensis TaxID=419257 RepID=UPI00349FC2B2